MRQTVHHATRFVSRRVRLAALFAFAASALVAGAGACTAGADGAATVTVDTLPGGITHTVTSAPLEPDRWSLVAQRDIQPPELHSAELFDPSDIAIADDGSILVADSKPTVIKVFDAQGRFARTIGREGEGPGEFRSAHIAVRGDTLVVQDARNARATTFNWRTGELLSERRTSCCYYSPIGIDGDGRVLVRAMMSPPDSTLKNAQAFVRFSLNGSDADSLFAVERQDTPETDPWIVRDGERMVMSFGVPMQPRLTFAVDPTHGFLTGWSGDYVLRTSTDGRDTVALFGRPPSPSAISDAEKRSLVDARVASMKSDNFAGVSEQVLRTAFDPAAIPDTRPAYETFEVDAAGRTWVRRVADPADSSTTAFDLFDTDGRWLDIVRVPAAGWTATAWGPSAWGRDAVAVVIEGEDGRPMVRVYGIARK